MKVEIPMLHRDSEIEARRRSRSGGCRLAFDTVTPRVGVKLSSGGETVLRPVYSGRKEVLLLCGSRLPPAAIQYRNSKKGMRAMKKLAALVAGSLVAVFLALPATVRAEIVDLLTFQSAVDAAQAVDPTLRPPANDGQHDFAVGGFERFNSPGFPGGHTGFSAQSGPSGRAVKGQVTSTWDSSQVQTTAGDKERYDVVCLAISGNRASMGLVPRDNAPPSNAAVVRGLTVQDGGPGGTLDLYSFWGPDPQDCAAHLGDAVFPIQHGNILVHDE